MNKLEMYEARKAERERIVELIMNVSDPKDHKFFGDIMARLLGDLATVVGREPKCEEESCGETLTPEEQNNSDREMLCTTCAYKKYK